MASGTKTSIDDIEIFRAGAHVDSSGRTLAFGWIKALTLRTDGILTATPEKVAPEFAEAVRESGYRKISTSLCMPDAPANPKPDQYYLRHVGFLGAPAPGNIKEDQLSDTEKERLAALETENAAFKANAASFAERRYENEAFIDGLPGHGHTRAATLTATGKIADPLGFVSNPLIALYTAARPAKKENRHAN